MKKLFTIALAALMLVGCSGNTATTTTTTTEPTDDAATTTASKMELGIGSITTMTFTDATADSDGVIQAYTTIVALGVSDGVISYIDIDVAQNSGKFDTAGVITSDKDAATPTKAEKGDDYGMKTASAIGKEWYEQADAFEQYALGKSVADVLATPTYKKDEHHTQVPDSDDLKTSVTIDIGAFLKALEVAQANLMEVENVETIKTASLTSLKLVDATADADGQVQVNTVFTLTATDADGKYVYVQLDVAQNGGKFDTAGVITSDKAAATPTKAEKADDYGMKTASAIGKEWYEQADAFEQYTLGKTLEEVLATPTYEKDEHHTQVPDSDDLKTSVTIDIEAFLKVLEAAANK